MPSVCSTDTFGKHSTHSLTFNECAVGSDKMVSARKEARPAHVEKPKMEVQDEGWSEKMVPTRALFYFDIQQARVWAFPASLSPVLSKSSPCLSHPSTLWWARLSLLVLYATHRAHDE